MKKTSPWRMMRYVWASRLRAHGGFSDSGGNEVLGGDRERPEHFPVQLVDAAWNGYVDRRAVEEFREDNGGVVLDRHQRGALPSQQAASGECESRCEDEVFCVHSVPC